MGRRSIRARAAGASLVGLACGCVPLQQAPLVYSSKVAVGIDVSSNAAESPGISISVGVKTIDAAYVPIAVSKESDPKAPQGAASTPDVIRIFARYGQGSTERDAGQLTEANKQKINAYIDARKSASDAAAVQASEDAQVADLKKKAAAIGTALATIQGLGDPPSAVPASGAASDVVSAYNAKVAARTEAIQKTLNPQISSIADSAATPVPSGTLDLAASRQALVGVEANTKFALQLRSAAAAAAAADAATKGARADELFKQAAQAASLLETSKTDAMSVFGRFDSNSTASVPSGAASGASVGLLIGKVFSTGLASQNLTEAAKIAAASSCLSTNLAAAFAAMRAASVPTGDPGPAIVAVANVCSSNPGR